MKHPLPIAAFLLCSSTSGVLCAQSAEPSSSPPVAATAAEPAPPHASDIAAPTPTGIAVAGNSTSMPMEGQPYHDEVRHTWPNRPMLLTGLVVLGGTYGASAIVGAVSDQPSDDKLFIPVVGPWLDLHERDCNERPCKNETLNKALLIGDGALQGVGALTLVLSLVIPESTKRPWYLIGNRDLAVVPRVGMNNTGLAAVGEF